MLIVLLFTIAIAIGHDIEGVWRDNNGSKMYLQLIEPDDVLVDGYYSNRTLGDGTYMLSGFLGPKSVGNVYPLSFTVLFVNGVVDLNGTTVWTGYYDCVKETIVTKWMYTGPPWRSTATGTSVFKR